MWWSVLSLPQRMASRNAGQEELRKKPRVIFMERTMSSSSPPVSLIFSHANLLPSHLFVHLTYHTLRNGKSIIQPHEGPQHSDPSFFTPPSTPCFLSPSSPLLPYQAKISRPIIVISWLNSLSNSFLNPPVSWSI